MFCQVEPEQVIAVHNVSSTYHVPLLLEKQGLIPTIRDILKLDEIPKAPALVARGQATWKEWQSLIKGQERFFETVSIALVGKYVSLHDSYLSVIKSLEHSAMRCNRKLNLVWIDAEHLEDATLQSDPSQYHKAWSQLTVASGCK